MRKWCVLLILLVFCSGCSRRGSVETVTDELAEPVLAPHAQFSMWLPQEAILEVMDNDAGKMYICDGYVLTVQTLASGDTEKTLKTLTGFTQGALQPLETQPDGIRRLDWVWTAMGEDGLQVCRGALLDDGNYHYCITAMAAADSAADVDEVWSRIFGSMTLS